MDSFLSVGDTKTISIVTYRTNNNQKVDFTYEIDKYSDTYCPCIKVKKDDKSIFVTAIKEGQSSLSVIINDNSRYGISFSFYIRSGD